MPKLTDEAKKEIRELYSSGNYTCRGLAITYKVSRQTILNVVKKGKPNDASRA